MTSVSAAVAAIVRRADERFETQKAAVYKETDRAFAWLMAGQWVFGIIVALTFSPFAWQGRSSALHAHVYAAVFLGGLLSAFPIALALRKPGWVLTRHVIAVAQMLWSALLIHLTGGRIETHFHVFGSLGFLSYYRDWRVLLTATLVVVADHLGRGMLWPDSVYGVLSPEWWRFLEHAFWVAFCNVFLTMACLRGVREMRRTADREAQIEALAESEWLASSAAERGEPTMAPSDDTEGQGPRDHAR